MLDAMREAQDGARRQILRQWLRDRRAMAALAARPAGEREAVILEVEDLAGRAPAAALRRAVRGAPQEVTQQAAPRSCRLEEVCAGAPGAPVPPGYEVTPDGLWRLDEDGPIRLAHRPLAVQERYLSVGHGDAWVRVGWPSGGRWHSEVVPRRTIADSRTLVGLSERDAPVTSGTAGAVSQYLAAQEAMLPAATRWASQSCGWVDGRYLWGHHTLGDGEALALVPEAEVAALADGLRAEGDWSAWLGMMDRCRQIPHVWIAVYAAVASCLMEPCGVQVGGVVSMAAPRRTGKTSVIAVAASVWGEPTEGRGIVRSWETSPYGLEQCSQLMSGVGLILDETSRIQARHRGQVASVIYGLANGSGRQRGGQRLRTWRLLALSTGEAPLRTFGGLEGAADRTIEITGPAMPDASTADVVAELAREHYGHLGPRVVQRVLGMDRQRLRDRYRERRAALQSEHPGHERAAGIVALLEAAAGLCRAVGVPDPGCDVWGRLWREIRRHASESDQAAAAWQVYEDQHYAEVQRGRWPQGTPVDYRTVLEWLTRAGYGPEQVAEWRRRGWVEVEADGHLARRYIHGARARVVIPRDAG